MGTISGALALTRTAFNKPTLSLLANKRAAIILTLFKECFTHDHDHIPVDTFHTALGMYLAELHADGEDVWVSTPGALGRSWVKKQWLIRSIDSADAEHYMLTSHSQEALDYVDRLSGERNLVSQSRIETILMAAKAAALDANPNIDDRIASLNADIDALTVTRDNLLAGGELSPASEDRIIANYLNLKDLLSGLPADFRRVSESVKDIHRQIVDEFRHDTRAVGEVLDTYLELTDTLMEQSLEGRAFNGAVELLRDETLLHSFATNLSTILAHPFATALTLPEQLELRNTVLLISRNITGVCNC